MDRSEFFSRLAEHKMITDGIVCFNDNFSDDIFVVNQNYNKWEVFYRERGVQFELKIFNSESDALNYLLNHLIDIYPKGSMNFK